MAAWLIELLAGAWVKWVAGIAAAGGLAWLKHRWPLIADKVLYGLLGFVLIGAILLGMRFDRFLSSQSVTVSAENVEDYIRTWSDNFGLAVQRVSEKESIEQAIFALRILVNDNPSVVYRPKDRPQYLNVQAGVLPSPDQDVLLGALSKQQLEELVEEIRLVLGGAGFDFLIAKDLKPITVVVRIPIAGLTEHVYIASIDRVLIGRLVARDAMVRALRRVKL